MQLTIDGRSSDTFEAFRDGDESQRIHPVNQVGERIMIAMSKSKVRGLPDEALSVLV